MSKFVYTGFRDQLRKLIKDTQKALPEGAQIEVDNFSFGKTSADDVESTYSVSRTVEL